MPSITRDTLRSLLAPHAPPCVSLYQPTHRSHPDNLQDPIRYRNLLRTIEASLREKHDERDVRALLERFRSLGDDSRFWSHTLDGIAILASPDTFRIAQLQRPVRELAVVADSFHLKPLLRHVQSADRFQVLALTRHTARLHEGNRYALDPLEVDGFPATMTAALGDQRTEPHQTVVSFGGGASGSAAYHGQGSRKDERDRDVERYFRIVHDDYLERLARLSEKFTAAEAAGRGTAVPADAAKAAVEGRVATLLLDADAVLPGRIDPVHGTILRSDLANPEIDDLLDDLGEAVLRAGGDVVVVPKERMPSTSGLAATFRF